MTRANDNAIALRAQIRDVPLLTRAKVTKYTDAFEWIPLLGAIEIVVGETTIFTALGDSLNCFTRMLERGEMLEDPSAQRFRYERMLSEEYMLTVEGHLPTVTLSIEAYVPLGSRDDDLPPTSIRWKDFQREVAALLAVGIEELEKRNPWLSQIPGREHFLGLIDKCKAMGDSLNHE